jgi:hypothetical protein
MSVISVDKYFDNLSLTLFADFEAPIERVWQLSADPRQLGRVRGVPAVGRADGRPPRDAIKTGAPENRTTLATPALR